MDVSMIPEALIRSNLQGLIFVAPEIILTLAIVILLVSAVVLPYQRLRLFFTILALIALAVALGSLRLLPLPSAAPMAYLSELFVWDYLTRFFKIFFILAGAFTVLLNHGNKEIGNQRYAESTLLVLSVSVGMMLLAAAADLLMIYVAFETMGILSYLLVGIKTRDVRGGEAALKYVLYGAFTSGIMLFGFSLLFGLAGTTGLAEIGRQVAAADTPQHRLLLVLAVLFFLVGLLFKTASFPFHFWCPDVYEGAPTSITAFLSVGPKAAGFALFIRLFYPLFAAVSGSAAYQAISGLDWPTILAGISAVTMTLGNLAAIQQNNLKRLLAYSSIAHAGYLLMGIVALSNLGLQAVLFYLVVYLFMNLGAFTVVTAVVEAGGGEEIQSYRGLGSKEPFACVAMAIFLFSLIGIPPFAGFVGKVYLFAAVISGKIYWLAVVAALNTVVSLYYYLRVVKAMFLESAAAAFQPRLSYGFRALLVVLIIPTIGLGLYWQPLVKIVQRIII
jgi:NADH-quinone oxidoreductase subunit N